MLGSGGKKQLKVFAQLGSIGIELALSTVLGILGGRWLDQKFDTEPFLTVLGLLIGITAGFRSLIRIARKVRREQDTDPDPSDR